MKPGALAGFGHAFGPPALEAVFKQSPADFQVFEELRSPFSDSSLELLTSPVVRLPAKRYQSGNVCSLAHSRTVKERGWQKWT